VSSRTSSPEDGVLAKWGGVHIRPFAILEGTYGLCIRSAEPVAVPTIFTAYGLY
jgi:hypothetical protein